MKKSYLPKTIAEIWNELETGYEIVSLRSIGLDGWNIENHDRGLTISSPGSDAKEQGFDDESKEFLWNIMEGCGLQDECIDDNEDDFVVISEDNQYEIPDIWLYKLDDNHYLLNGNDGDGWKLEEGDFQVAVDEYQKALSENIERTKKDWEEDLERQRLDNE